LSTFFKNFRFTILSFPFAKMG